MRIPSRIILAMLSGNTACNTIGTTKHDWAGNLPARHIACFCRAIDDLVNRLHGEIKSHKLDHWLQTSKGRADAETGNGVFGDRRVDNTLGAKLIEQALG